MPPDGCRYLESLESRWESLGARGSLAAVRTDDGQDLFLAEDHVVIAVELDLAAGVLAHEDAVALLDIHRRALPLVVELARADRDHLGLLRLLFGAVRNDDAAPDLLFLLNALHQDTIVQRTNIHSAYLLGDFELTRRLGSLRPAVSTRPH